jgi:hypothetical protein
MEELKDNSKVYPFYLSLITNNRGEWTGKVCVYEEKEYIEIGKRKTKNINGDFVESEYTSEFSVPNYLIWDCDIYSDIPDCDKLFTDRVSEIIKEASKKQVVKYSPSQYNHKPQVYNYQQALTMDDVIEEFFSDENFGMIYVANNAVYEQEYSPELFVAYVEKHYYFNAYNFQSDKLEFKSPVNWLNKVISSFKTYNTTFSKKLIKDYERYIKELTTKV